MGRRILFILGVFALTLGLPGTVRMDARAAPAEKVTDVGVQQQRVQRDFQELELKVLRVIAGLQETDPERARQLQNALDWARDKVLSGQLGAVADLLNANKLMEARELQPAMTVDLEEMLRRLQSELSEYDRLQKRIEQLQEWLGRAQALAREEWREMRDSEKAQDRSADQKRSDEQIARLERLLAAQKELRDRTGKTAAGGQPRMGREAEDQKGLEKETRALQEDLRQAAEGAEVPEETRTPEAGEQALAAAAGEQAQAAKNLDGQQASAAMENQAKAVRNMEQALREMKQERERQQRQNSAMAKAAQDQTEQQTGALGQDMAQAEAQQGEGQPGQSSVQQAQQAMQQASSQLGQNSPGKAAPRQKEAQKQLGKAAEDLKKEIQRAKDEQRDALRTLLKEMLEKMLVQQKAATLRTAALDDVKQKRKWADENRQDLTGVRESEERLGRMAQEATDKVAEDGSSVVFAALLMELQKALTDVVFLLAAEETGPRAQGAQREIERMIEELLAALEDNPDTPPSDPEDSKQDDRPQRPKPLIALAQELRLLKAQQIRVNQRTADIQKDFKATNRQERKADLPRLSERQRKIQELTRDLLRKASGQAEDPWDAI